jgi:uncharacterized protein
VRTGQVILAAYGLLAAVSLAVALWLRGDAPWSYPTPYWSLPAGEALVTSALLGILLALVVIAWTRWSVARYRWATNLHRELRPFARTLRPGEVFGLACLSSLGEELFFRALLLPWLGLPLASLLFALAHQLRGPSRWVWVLWAGMVGAAFGGVFVATGSLLGSLLAHGLINGINLLFLQRYNPDPPASRLGGLLRR